MKLKSMLLTTLLTGLTLASSLAQAHPPGRGGWHGGVGVYVGRPFFYGPPPMAYPYGYPYGYPYAYSPPPVIVTQPQPQVYIEQGNNDQGVQVQPPATSNSSGQTSSNQNFWYYCEQSDGYYPYVKECPAGWKQVTPSPPPSTSTR